MKSIKKKLIAGLLVGAMMAAMMCFPAMAATSIKSVSIKVNTVPEVGMTYEEIDSQIDSWIEATSNHYTFQDAEVSYSKDKEIAIGDEVKVIVYIYANNDYYFSSASKDKVKVSGGEFVSGKRTAGNEELQVTIKLKPAKGDYEEPQDVEWASPKTSLGLGKWVAPDNGSGYYDIALVRGSTTVYTLTGYHGTSFNFYPWMTRKGDYHFKVRTVPYTDAQRRYGKKSEYAESDEIYIDEKQVSDGSGQNYIPGYTGKAGWITNGGHWYYIYPDGTMVMNKWDKINNKWYLFGADGAMLTGWQTIGGHTYYLDVTSGEMKTGWIATTAGTWYYLNPNVNGPEGAMVRNAFVQDGKNTFYLTDSGVMATGWVNIAGNMYYFYPQAGAPMGAMARNTTIDTFYVDQNGIWRK